MRPHGDGVVHSQAGAIPAAIKWLPARYPSLKQQQQPAGRGDGLVAKYYTEQHEPSMTRSVASAVRVTRGSPASPLRDLVQKLNLCIKIFFPDKPKELSPKEEVKRRLKMVGPRPGTAVVAFAS